MDTNLVGAVAAQLACVAGRIVALTEQMPKITDRGVLDLFEEQCLGELHNEQVILLELTKLVTDGELDEEPFEEPAEETPVEEEQPELIVGERLTRM